ncbi:inner centromere protein A-like isoform X1 [Salvelinus alpinus]|uniref:inner centromere protein A-like isoform X1 n=1 Tax=Salvelinus alpinus TaxID=8036 RepID=UPI0039FDCEA0
MVAAMSSVLTSTRTLMQMFDVNIQAFANEIENDHMVWLFEIQHEANRIFSSDFSAEPELMPKTPSQKKSNRKKRLSVGQNENRNKRRFSKGKRSNLRRSSVSTTLNLIAEDEGGSPVTREELVEPSRARRTKQTTQPEVASPVRSTCKGAAQTSSSQPGEAQQQVSSSISQIQEENMQEEAESKRGESSSDSCQPPCFSPSRSRQTQSHITEAVVKISAAERQSAELQMNRNAERSPGRAAIKIVVAAATHLDPRRRSVRHSLTVRLSLAGLRNSMTQESVRRASRRSFLKKKKKKARLGSSTCSSNVSGLEDVEADGDEEVKVQTDGVLSEEPTETGCLGPETSPEFNTVSNHPGAVSVEVRCFTRSMAQTPPTMPTPASIINKAKTGTPDSGSDGSGKKPPSSLGPRLSAKRRVAAERREDFQTPGKWPSLLKKSQSVRPNVRKFLHTVQKNQMLMMTPSSLARSTVIKSFIKHTTPGSVDLKSGSGLVERERLKLEALKKKQEQEEERRKEMDEEKRRKQEEMKKKRDERLRRLVEARVKEEEKEKKILQIEKHNTLRVERVAEDKARKKVATKRQDELEPRRRKKIQQAEEEEEKRQQELQAKRRAEEEQERTRKMAEARLAIEKEQERTRKMAEARLAMELEKEQERTRKMAEARLAMELEKEQERTRKMAEARLAMELEKEQERTRKMAEAQLAIEKEQERTRKMGEARLAMEPEKEQERERRDAAERERVKREQAFALQREVERAAREKERNELCEKRELERRRRREEQQRQAEEERHREADRQTDTEAATTAAKSHLTAEVQTPVGEGGVINVTVDIERSPQSYEITPKGGNKPVILNTNPEDYGMDQNSEDSTDDESAPRKHIPKWAKGDQLKQTMKKQYFNPMDVDCHYGEIEPPMLDHIFYKNKPRYLKRTSSGIWHSPPKMEALPI